MNKEPNALEKQNLWRKYPTPIVVKINDKFWIYNTKGYRGSESFTELPTDVSESLNKLSFPNVVDQVIKLPFSKFPANVANYFIWINKEFYHGYFIRDKESEKLVLIGDDGKETAFQIRAQMDEIPTSALEEPRPEQYERKENHETKERKERDERETSQEREESGEGKETEEKDRTEERERKAFLEYQKAQNLTQVARLEHYFRQFDSRENIEIFDNFKAIESPLSEPPVRVKLPRYNLDFVSQKYKDNWQLFLKDEPNLRLILDKPKPSFFNQGFNSWLWIEDTRVKPTSALEPGIPDQFVMVPKQSFTADADKLSRDQIPTFNLKGKKIDIGSSSLIERYKRTARAELVQGTESYVKIRVEKGKLIPETGDDLCYIAYIHLYTQNPKAAYDLLTKGLNAAPMLGTPEERKWLHEMIMHHNDKHTTQVFQRAGFLSVQLQATYLLIKNHLEVNPSLLDKYYKDADFIQRLKENYFHYLDTLKNTPVELQLPPEVEFNLLEFLVTNPAVKFEDLPKTLIPRYQTLNGWSILKERQILINLAKTQKSELTEQRLFQINQMLDKGEIRVPYMLEVGDEIHLKEIREAGEIKKLAEEGVQNFEDILNDPLLFAAHFKYLASIASLKDPIDELYSKELADFLAAKKRVLIRRIYEILDEYHIRERLTERVREKIFTPLENLILEFSKTLLFIAEDPSKYSSFLQEKSQTLESCIQFVNSNNERFKGKSPLVELAISHDMIDSHWPVRSFDALSLETVDLEGSLLTSSLEKFFNLPERPLIESEIKREKEYDFAKFSTNIQKDYEVGQKKNQAEKVFREFCRTKLKKYLEQHEDLPGLSEKEQFSVNLAAEITQFDAETTSIQKKLVELANRQYSLRQNQLALLGQENRKLKMEDLITLFLSKNPHRYAQATGLSFDEIKELHDSIHQYLIKSTHLNHLKRVNTHLKALKGKEPGRPLNPKSSLYQQILENLGQELYGKRQNYDSYLKEPALLVFEHFENITLRDNQVAMLKTLFESKDGRFKDSVIQLIMGGGKSKVLMPLSVQQKAQGDNLCIVEVPPALFETNLVDLQRISRQLFNQEAIPFQFTRSNAYSAEYLENLYNRLEACMLQKNYLVTTGNSMRSLALKYNDLLETLEKEPGNQKLWAQFEWVERILKLIKFKGDCFIDEVDSALNIQQDLNYPIGAEQSLDPLSIQAAIELYQSLIDLEPKIKSIDELIKYYSEKPQSYLEEKLKLFPSLLIEKNPERHKALFEVIKDMTSEKRNKIIDYLLNKPDFDAAFIKSLPNDHKNILAIYKHQINTLLPVTLSKRDNEHYGLSKLPITAAEMNAKEMFKREIPIPYSASQKPKEGSQFANIYTASNYAIQYQFLHGISLNSFKQMIQTFKKRAITEFNTNRKRNTFSLSDTEAAKEFSELTGIAVPLNDLNLSDTGLLNELLSGERDGKRIGEPAGMRPRVIQYALQNYILPNVTVHSKMLSMNAIQEASLYHSVQGTSGTSLNLEKLSR